MGPKGKLHQFVWASLMCCVLNFCAGGSLLGYSIYNHEYKKRHVDVKVVEDWVKMSGHLIIYSSIIIVAALCSLYGVTKRRKRDFPYAAAILIIHIGLVAAGVYFTYKTWDMIDDKLPVSEDTIFKSTRRAIAKGARKHHNPKWVPKWLDSIQNKSQSCCGIRTFRDWNKLWKPQIRGIRDHVPKSCCRKGHYRGCYTDLTAIPFPETVADNIKVDAGCGYEINKFIKKFMKESYKVLFAVTGVLGFGLLVFSAQYAFVYFFQSKLAKNKKEASMISLKKPPPISTGPSDWKSLKSLNFSPSNQKTGPPGILKDKRHHRPRNRSGSGGPGSTAGSETGNNNYAQMTQSIDSIQTGTSVGSSASVGTDTSQQRQLRLSDNGSRQQVFIDPTPTFAPLQLGDLPEQQQQGGRYIKNALGYIEKEDLAADNSAYPYDYGGLGSIDNMAEEGFETGAVQTDMIPGEELFPEDGSSGPSSPTPFGTQTGTGTPSPGPGSGSGPASDENSGEENNVTRHHHKHHRVQVKGILHTPGKKHHHHRRKSDDEPL